MLDSLFIEQCKNPVVPTQIVKMIVQEESSKNPYSINVNKDGKSFVSFTPKTKDEAIKIAQTYINAGFSVDVGYMQLNSDNFELFYIDDIAEKHKGTSKNRVKLQIIL